MIDWSINYGQFYLHFTHLHSLCSSSLVCFLNVPNTNSWHTTMFILRLGGMSDSSKILRMQFISAIRSVAFLTHSHLTIVSYIFPSLISLLTPLSLSYLFTNLTTLNWCFNFLWTLLLSLSSMACGQEITILNTNLQ